MTRAAALAVAAALSAASLDADAPPWLTAAAAAKVEVPADAPAVVLLDETSLTVSGAGEITTRHRRAIRVLTAAGREHAYAAVAFDNDTKLKHLRAWSIDRAGSVQQAKTRDTAEVSPYDYELYSDRRVKIARLSGIDIGSVFAYEYEQRERPYVLQTAWHFQETLPVHVARFELVLPSNWSYEPRWVNFPAAEPVSLSASAATWELRSIPAIADEPRMPEASALAGRLGIHFVPPNGGAQRSWSDVARWFAGLASTRVAPSAPMQAKVRELAAGSDPIRALARFAQNDVRYVAIEIGIGGYQPHAAADVFAKRYGDCKDKATVLRAMLREIGVDAHYVLVHTTRGRVDPAFPSVSSFNHVIAAIPLSDEAAEGKHAVIEHPKLGKLLLFDPTITTTPYGHLPPWLQASKGLLVTADGGELIDLPAHAPDANRLERKATLSLDAAGTLSGTVHEVRTGHVASEMRSRLQQLTATERVQMIESGLAQSFGSYTAKNVTIEHLDDAEAELVIRYEVTAPRYAKQVASMLLLRPRVIGQKSEPIVAAESRRYDFVTDGPSVQTDAIDIALPPGLSIDELPPPVSIDAPAVRYTSASKFEDGRLRYQRTYSLRTFSVARDQIAEMNGVWTKIAADERASAVLVRR